MSETDLVCVFQDVSDAQRAASGLEGHPRVSFRMATMEDIRQKAFNRPGSFEGVHGGAEVPRLAFPQNWLEWLMIL